MLRATSLFRAVRQAAPRRTMSGAPLYTAEATAVGVRNGHVKSSDGILDFDLSVPKGMGGPGGAKTNPEQLFAAGYSACFGGALGAAQGMLKLPKLPDNMSVNAKVSIGKGEGGFDLAVDFVVTAPGYDKADLQKIIDKAHTVCPYSRATKGNMPVTTVIG
ncbi:organic hydroperoxide resistance protein [Hyaloraphidium curvatum]|nr:organic hydroperoxide resistance protein [Hyaloraphidium curvatum]KAI9010049.1 organic hydroperoxide resistance protein [Hyaloraphidium curvatum]